MSTFLFWRRRRSEDKGVNKGNTLSLKLELCSLLQLLKHSQSSQSVLSAQVYRGGRWIWHQSIKKTCRTAACEKLMFYLQQPFAEASYGFLLPSCLKLVYACIFSRPTSTSHTFSNVGTMFTSTSQHVLYIMYTNRRSPVLQSSFHAPIVVRLFTC